MSSSPHTLAPPSNFKPIFDAALSEYKKKTGKELMDHSLAAELQRCDTVDAVLVILQDQAKGFQQFQDGDQRLMKWIGPLARVLYASSGTLDVGDIGLDFSPAKGIVAGIGVLLAAAKYVRASHDALVELFERIESLFKRLGDYTQISPTTEMAEVYTKIMAEVLSILSIATKEVKRWRAKIYFRKLLGRTDIEVALKRLDGLIQEEIRMATTHVMKVTSELKDDVKKADLAIANNINKLKWDQKEPDVGKWFSPPDPSTNHNTACEVYHDVPSMWFFETGLFKDWVSNGSSLWIHGKSGSGKTVLCSAIVQHIMKLRDAGQATLAYYYFDFQDKEKQNVRNFVISVLVQLSEYSTPCRDIIYRLYSAHGNGTRQPSNNALTDCLKEMLTAAAEHSVFIIIDALDECLDPSGIPTPREAILDVVKDFAHMHPFLHLCFTSRSEVDVQTKLMPLSINAVSLHGQSGRKRDIANYVSSVVSLDENLRNWEDEDKKLVVEELSERADGMFQWVFCQLETLRHSIQPDVRRVLEILPKTLDETYERVLKDVNENNREHARRLLHCLAVSMRPLRVEELAEILRFDFDGAEGGIPTYQADRRPEDQEEAVLSTCSSLITIVNDGDSRVVQFSHLSVKEFLMSNHLASSTGDLCRFHILPRSAHTIFAQACLGFLLHSEDHIDDESLKGYPLAKYAARYWVAHAQFENVASSVEDGMKSLFDLDKPHFSAWVRTYDMDRQSDEKSQPEMPNPLYYSALCGFRDLVKHLVIKHPQLVNAIGGLYEFPLVAALCGKHLRVAEVLLEHGGAVDVRGRTKETALHKLVQLNEETVDVVQFLLERGADVNARREDLWTPLHLAVDIGQLKVAQLLLEHHADVNSQDDEGRAPLHLLSGREVLLREDNDTTLALTTLLLESGANVNVRAKDNATPLHLASYTERLEIVRVLLDHGANTDAENDEGRTPLQEAFRGDRHSQEDGVDVAELLLERGAEAYARDKYHLTASALAFCFGEQKIWKAVLGNGAEFSLVNDRDRTAFHLWLKECAADRIARHEYDTILLHSASYHGKVEMAQVLLDHGVKVNAKNHHGEMALHVVSRGKHSSQEGVCVAQLLLERGADVNMENNSHATSLHVASNHGRPDIAQVLLDYGAKANTVDISLWTPLHRVSCGEYESQESGTRVAQLLLEQNVDVNASDMHLWTPLHFASCNRRLEIVQVLLDSGAKVNTKNEAGQTPLHLVSLGKYDPQDSVRIAQLLMDRGADVNARRKDQWTPLHETSYFGRLDIARLLLDHGAQSNAEDHLLRTPLHTVSVGEYESKEDGVRIARLLLERGVDVNARDKNGETPLHLASSNGRLEIARVLLDHSTVKNDGGQLEGQTPSHLGFNERGVDVNAQRRDQWTPLHLASFHGRPEIARMLLNHGAKANAEDNLLRTPLHYVSEGRYGPQEDGVHVAQLLLEHGADINAHDINRETPLHSASSSGNPGIVRVLLEHATVKDDQGQNQRGVDVNARRRDLWTPLHLASRCGFPEIVQVLLNHGAKANAEDNLLRTPLHHVAAGLYYGSQEDSVRVLQLLLECGVDVNSQDIERDTPLHLASSCGNIEIVRVLLGHATVKNDRGQNPSHPGSEERSVEVDARRSDDQTPLHLASLDGRLEIARMLIDHGASVNAESNLGETPLSLVSQGVYDSQDDGIRTAQLLLERGANVNAKRKDHWTPLHAASSFGRPDIVRMLLDHGAKANAENRQGKNSLDLVSRGEYESQEDGVRVAQLLLERGVDVNASDQEHCTPLHSASYYGRSEIVRVLLGHGAKANVENGEGETPLDLVSRGKYHSQGDGVRIAQLLLDHGANVNEQRTRELRTPLYMASYYGRPGIVRVLVDHGATVNAKNSSLRTPLHEVSRGEYESQEDGARVAQLLLERGADINAQDIGHETPLHLASSSGRVEVVRVLLDRGAVANTETYDGETPLHAISRGKYDSQNGIRLVQLLMERGLDANARDKDHGTPLHSACYFGKPDIARELLDRGATATAQNVRGETPLHIISQGVYEPQDGVRLAQLLLEHGADLNAPNTDNDTPLHSACCNGKLDIARLLLSRGAAANVENNQGETPLHVLSENELVSRGGVRAVARLLLEQGVDVNKQDKHHRTPLHAASIQGCFEFAQVLLDYGATANARDFFGWTPLHFSSQNISHPEERGISVARLLLERGADINARDMNYLTALDLSSRRGWWPKMTQVLLEHETNGKLA